MRKFAISDIHGAKATFVALLDELQFSISDELYLLGDYIDRGPDSKGVIDLIWELQGQGYNIHCLRGNHEQMLIDLCDSPYRSAGSGYPNMLKSFGIEHAQEIDSKYLYWMRNLGYYFEVDHYILTHAGLNFKGPAPLLDTQSMMWIRNTRDHFNRNWLDGRIVVHGHTPTPKSAIQQYVNHLDIIPDLVIDSGCVFGQRHGLGYLCALELGSQQLTFMSCVDEVS